MGKRKHFDEVALDDEANLAGQIGPDGDNGGAGMAEHVGGGFSAAESWAWHRALICRQSMPADMASPNAMDEFVSYVFVRTNPPGKHRELWYHSAGCHAWLVVTREIATHNILSVELAKDVALARNQSGKETA